MGGYRSPLEFLGGRVARISHHLITFKSHWVPIGRSAEPVPRSAQLGSAWVRPPHGVGSSPVRVCRFARESGSPDVCQAPQAPDFPALRGTPWGRRGIAGRLGGRRGSACATHRRHDDHHDEDDGGGIRLRCLAVTLFRT